MSEKDEKALSVLKFVSLFLRKKTPHCRHKSPDCATHAVEGFLVNLKYGLMIRGAVTLLQLVMRKQKLAKLSLGDQLRFPAFLALFALISKFVMCFLRRIRGKEDGLNSFLAGFLGGLSVLVHKDQSTRKLFALYLFSRAYDSGYLTLEKRGIIPNIPNLHIVFTQIVSIQWIYIYFAHRDWFNLSYFAIMLNLFHVHKEPNDHVMLDIITKIANNAANVNQ